MPTFPLALHTWTLDTTPLADALAATRRAGFDAIELRRIDFKRLTDQGWTTQRIVDLVRGSGLPVATLGCEYGWVFAKGEESARLFQALRDTCATAVALGCRTVMSSPGPYAGTMAEAVANMRTAAEIAAEFGVRIAFEFSFQHPIINRLEVIRDLVAAVGKPSLGLLLDAYHLARSGRPGRGFAEVREEEIVAFQYSDVPLHPTADARPTDRLPPGKGVIPWRDVFQLLAEKNYHGYLSYEAPNPLSWSRPAEEVAREAVAATRAFMTPAGVQHLSAS
jgi:sugar phosphate isomerase/epimerase